MPSPRSILTTAVISLVVIVAYQKYGDRLPIGK